MHDAGHKAQDEKEQHVDCRDGEQTIQMDVREIVAVWEIAV